ncbi:MAG TPA: hypothetical protein VI670_16395 [Thermoanaerobaculia bacterium]|jgi:hypothetical protein
MTTEEIKASAAELAAAMRAESIDAATRQRFIALRTALFQRGVYDPVLVRFDSATAPRATNAEIAEELEKIAAA